MKICVTGGTGLVGNAVKKFANNLKQHEFYYVSRSFATDNNNKGIDLTNIREVEEYFKKHKFDYIIHLAANVGGLYKNMNGNID